METKKGMSAIVITVIMVALALVAVGVVWTVINNLIGGKSDEINLQLECLDIQIESTTATNCTGTACNLFVERKAGGKDIDGIKVVFNDGTISGTVLDRPGNIVPLATVSQSWANVGVNNPIEVGITPYFIGKAGDQQLCPRTNTKKLS